MNSKNSGNCCPGRAPAPSVTVIQIYACGQCHNLFHQDFVEKGEPHLACPVCRQSLRETNLVRAAVKNDGSREPMGSMDCHRR